MLRAPGNVNVTVSPAAPPRGATVANANVTVEGFTREQCVKTRTEGGDGRHAASLAESQPLVT